MNTQYKPLLKNYGNRKKLNFKLNLIFIMFLLVTPFTNWLIPIARKYIKGDIVVYL